MRFDNKVNLRSREQSTSQEKRLRRLLGVQTAPKRLDFTAAGTRATVDRSAKRPIGFNTKNTAQM